MIAATVRDTDLAAYQRAARTLLVNPLVTRSTPDADALPLVRRFAADLARDFDAIAGYRLELFATGARLLRRLDRLDPTQVVQPRDRKPFDRRRYAYLCLVLGAVGRAGQQVALTELADALRRRAAEVDTLRFDADSYRHRLAFVDVVSHLTEVGVLRPVEAAPVAWLRDPTLGEVLYDVDSDAAHLLFYPPRVIQHVRSVRSLLTEATAASRDTRRAETRQRLVRLLLEHPVVYVDDLDGAERTYLVSQSRALADDLGRLTGGQLERRAEGMALIDAIGGFSDRRFPAGGTPRQAALLLIDAIAARLADGEGDLPTATVPTAADTLDALVARLDRARPSSTAAAVPLDVIDDDPDTGVPDGAPLPVEGPFLADAWLAEQAGELCGTHGKAFAGDLRDDPAALLAAAVEVLVAFDLVRSVPGGVVARPALARYRDVRVTMVASPRLSLLDPSQEAVR